MRQLRERSKASVERLRAELELYEVLKTALESKYEDDPQALLIYTSRARRLVYANVIIASYGLIEQGIDEILQEAAESISSIYRTNADLPDKLKTAHRDLLLQCLKDGDRARIRRPLAEADALRALGANPGEPPELQANVFTLSSANYRWPYISELFSRLALQIDTEVGDDKTQEALDKLGFASFESFLSTLVTRRNDLAHSYGDDDIENPSLLASYVDVADGLLSRVVSSVELQLLGSVLDQQLRPSGTVVKIWTERIGVTLHAGLLEVGGKVVVRKNGRAEVFPIRSMQSDGASADAFAPSGQPIDVSIGTTSVSQSLVNADLYVIPAQWHEYLPGENVASERVSV